MAPGGRSVGLLKFSRVLRMVYSQARKLAKHVQTLAPLRSVMITPEGLSNYHRNIHRNQSQFDRICSVEALAVLLKDVGESTEVYEALIDLVELNNRALRYESASPSLYHVTPAGKHPAWYYGDMVS